MLNYTLTKKNVIPVEYLIIALFSALPLLVDLPYRVNIYLTWEGAYRMYLGQFPFRDFGLPMGYGFWIIPFVFFKIFGPYLFSLVLAQAFINFVSFIVLNQTLKLFQFTPVQRVIALAVFGLSFTIINFWPWYNHTPFVFQMIGLYFLCYYLTTGRRLWYVPLSAAFAALCFFTKQDAGGLALMLSLALLAVSFIQNKDFKAPLFFIGGYVVMLGILILPLLRYDFSYWFNLGQPPHYSRVNSYHFVTAFFEESLWLKFYLGAMLVILLTRYKSFKEFWNDRLFLLYTLLTAGILVQAMIIQVTSFSPPTVNYYYHTFGVAYLMYALKEKIAFEKLWIAVVLILVVFTWRSDQYWKYTNRILGKVLPSLFAPPPSNVVSKTSWSAKKDTVEVKPVIWENSSYRTLKRIKLPQNTIEGVNAIVALKDEIKTGEELKVLNMSNLTFLAYELGYKPDTGPDFPLWFHQGVAFFDREAETLCNRVKEGRYDIVLFEDMPDVDNFFPYSVRDCLRENNYTLVTRFLSPTGYLTDSVEVYTKVIKDIP